MVIQLLAISLSYSWLWLPVLLLFSAALTLLLYYKNKKNTDLPKGLSIVLGTIRFSLLGLLFFILLKPVIQLITIQKERPILIIACDNSESLKFSKDSLRIKEFIKTKLGDIQKNWNDEFEIVNYGFGDKLEKKNTTDLQFKQTNISNVFEEIENNYTNRNIGALLLISDGLYNQGKDPISSIDKLNYPVYTIALGDTTPYIDWAINKVTHNNIAYLGNKFPVEININAIKLIGKNAELTIKHNGGIVAQKKIVATADNFNQSFPFILDAKNIGSNTYVAQITIDGAEQNKQNNVFPFFVDVIDNREKVLILAQFPHPDVNAIKQSIESNMNYEVASFTMDKFDDKKIGAYNLVILHDLNLLSVQYKMIKQYCIDKQIPIWNINTSNGDSDFGLTFSNANRYNDAEPILDKNFNAFTLSDALKSYIGNFPALKVPFNKAGLVTQSEALFYQRIGVVETQSPMWIFNTNNGYKTSFTLGDGLWKWRLNDYEEHESHNLFNELINKTIQYLAVKNDKSAFRVFTQESFKENEPIQFQAELYNDSYEAVVEPEVSLTIKNDKNASFPYTFSKLSNNYTLNAGLMPPGSYTYEASVNYNGKIRSKKGKFTIKELVEERLNLVANHRLLNQLAIGSGGKYYDLNHLETLVQDLKSDNDIKTINHTSTDFKDLINLKYLFFILLSLLTIEWFLRKRNGLY